MNTDIKLIKNTKLPKNTLPPYKFLEIINEKHDSIVIKCKSNQEPTYENHVFILKILLSSSIELKNELNIHFQLKKQEKEYENSINLYYLPLLEYYYNEKLTFLLYNYIFYGDLWSFISIINKKLYKFYHSIYYKSLRSLFKLHSLGIIHGDIKPENILVDYNHELEGYSFKICDFQKNRRTKEYLSPELIANSLLLSTVYDDLYAFGVCYYVLIYNRFESKDSNEEVEFNEGVDLIFTDLTIEKEVLLMNKDLYKEIHKSLRRIMSKELDIRKKEYNRLYELVGNMNFNYYEEFIDVYNRKDDESLGIVFNNEGFLKEKVNRLIKE